METDAFSARDREQMRSLGISEDKARAELAVFRSGQAYASLERACTVGDGILRLSPAERESLSRGYRQAADAGRAMQFIPASGAATRMFKALIEVLARQDAPDFRTLVQEGLRGDKVAEEFLAWFQELGDLPFRDALAHALADRGLDMEALIESGAYRPILECMLREDGLGYAEMPKALIPFHAHPDGVRTAMEEHLAEAKALVRDKAGICRLHFTISPRHKMAFEKALKDVLGRYEADGTRFDIALSEQDPSTDTLAADEQGRPFRDKEGRLVFRPGGHGALLANLAGCGGDLVFIKNIDNVVPDARRPEITAWRRAMGGLLVETQALVFRHLEALRESPEPGRIAAAAGFVESALGTHLPPDFTAEPSGEAERESAREYLIRLLDRPLRVCGMVENRGEPGGGPFWVRQADGSLRLQIVETPQVDPHDPRQTGIASGAAYFNPTDLVCGLRDSRGNPFRLEEFADPDAAFIVSKSKDGRPLKALELPGLWNGSMAGWNSVFMEMPAENFNPVKSVADLLRSGHVQA